jgi:hypothetical protein
MNIFILDTNPRIAAKMHCDKHVPKMILETAQMLSTAHHVYDTPQAPLVYKKAHLNHPCTIWVRESVDNYSWAFELFRELNNEFVRRRGKKHLSWVKSQRSTSPTLSAPSWAHTLRSGHARPLQARGHRGGLQGVLQGR